MKAVAPRLSTGRVLALLGCILLVLAPHATRLPLWIAAVAAWSLGLRAVFAWRGWGLPKTWMLLILAASAAVGIWLSYGQLFGRDAAVALLILMLCLKLMELRAERDAYVLILLGYFLVITDFLYSQSIPTALYLLVCVWFVTACLIAFQHRDQPPRPAAVLRQAGWMLAQAAPLMLVFFLLFPRVQGPLWGFPQAAYGAVSGLSDTMAPGSLSSLSLSDDVAFRVDFTTPPPTPARLYWRGPVMWDFDGRTWRAGDSAPLPLADDRPRIDQDIIRYAVTLEPHNLRWLFGADLPAQRPKDSLLTHDYQLLALRPVRQRMRYAMSSQLNYRIGLTESPRNLERALRLPKGFNPRSLELARQLQQDHPDAKDIVRNALLLFREKPFFYTLVPPELGRDSVDEFLFTTRRGFCEHFASSFVFLMRAAGVPARIVTGYQGGVFNPIGAYLIVRQSEAHAWAEVWLDGEGWVRIDPTAAVSPQRIESGIAAAMPLGEPLPLMVRTDSALLRQLRFGLDAAANGWNQWVLGYTPERQLRIFERAGFGKANWQNLALALSAATALVLAVLSLLLLRKLRRPLRDPVQVLWDEFSRKLSRRGLPRRPGEGPVDYVRRVTAGQPMLAGDIAQIGALYTRLRYGASTGNARELAELRRRVRAFRP